MTISIVPGNGFEHTSQIGTNTASPGQIPIAQSDGTILWEDLPYNMSVIFDGGGSTLTSGTEVIIRVPADMTLEGATLVADQTGSIILDVLKSTYAGYPTMATIVAAAPPTISAATKSQDLTLTGWTTSLLEGDLLKVMINGAVTNIVSLSVNLHGVRI